MGAHQSGTPVPLGICVVEVVVERPKLRGVEVGRHGRLVMHRGPVLCRRQGLEPSHRSCVGVLVEAGGQGPVAVGGPVAVLQRLVVQAELVGGYQLHSHVLACTEIHTRVGSSSGAALVPRSPVPRSAAGWRPSRRLQTHACRLAARWHPTAPVNATLTGWASMESKIVGVSYLSMPTGMATPSLGPVWLRIP